MDLKISLEKSDSNIIQTSYPAPIALSYRQVLRSFTKKEEHDRLLDTLEISAMTLAAILASQYRADDGNNQQIDDSLSRSSVASFGTWTTIIEKIQVEYSKIGELSIGRWIGQKLGQKSQYPAQRKALEEIFKITGQDQQNIPTKFTPVYFITQMVSYRNEIAHAKPSPSEEVCRARLNWLGPAVEEFLRVLIFLSEYPIVFLNRLEIKSGKIVGLANFASGWDLDRSLREYPSNAGAIPWNLYICNPKDNTITLPILPILTYMLCEYCSYEPRVFLLRKAQIEFEQEKPQKCVYVDYTCPVCGKRYRNDNQDVLNSFMRIICPLPFEVGTDVNNQKQGDTNPFTPKPVEIEVEDTVTTNVALENTQKHSVINPNVRKFLALYSQSEETNQGTRGLDSFGLETYVKTKLDMELKPLILDGKISLVILTGNAGDGKTAFIQLSAAKLNGGV